MYAVHIETHRQLHSSILDAIENPVDSLHRLYLIQKDNIEYIRDSTSSVLCLFSDVTLKPDLYNPDLSCIKANVVGVHVLGEFHSMESSEFEGWIKVKIAHTNTINTRLPTRLAHRLFEKKEQIPRRIFLRTTSDKKSSLYNEYATQFMCNVMQSSTKSFEASNSLPIIENMLDVINSNEHTPPLVNRYIKSKTIIILNHILISFQVVIWNLSQAHLPLARSLFQICINPPPSF